MKQPTVVQCMALNIVIMLIWNAFLLVSYKKLETTCNESLTLYPLRHKSSSPQNKSSSPSLVQESIFDMWHDDSYYLHINETLPLLKTIPNEYEYYSSGIISLDKYPTLKSYVENDYNETSGESTLEQLTKLTSDELKRLYFTDELIASLKPGEGGKFNNDLHQDDKLYTITKRKFNTKQPYEITTKLSTLLVHTVFSYNLQVREEFASYPIISNRSREKYCNNGCSGHFCVICEESTTKKQDSKFFYSKPWCFKSNLDYSILSVEDGIFDNGVSNTYVPGPLFDKNGNILVMSTPHSITFKPDVPIHYEPMFAVVGVVYNPTAAGHFPMESLPRVIFLSYFLPLHIPILMNDIPRNRYLIDQLKESGIIHPKRKIIWAPDHYYIGKRVYFLHSRDQFAPLTPDIVMRMATTLYSQFYSTNYLSLTQSIRNSTHKEYILVIDRSDVGNRMIVNQDKMIESLKEFTTPLNIDVIPVKLGKVKSVMELGAIFYGAVAIIAPHGAGLANINSVNREKIKFVMEVGWKGGWPADFYCGPRSMGVKYIALVCDNLDFDVDINEVMDHVKREFKDYKI